MESTIVQAIMIGWPTVTIILVLGLVNSIRNDILDLKNDLRHQITLVSRRMDNYETKASELQHKPSASGNPSFLFSQQRNPTQRL